MKTNSILLKTWLLCCSIPVISASILAQQLDSRSAYALVKRNASSIGLTVADLSDLRVSYAYVDEISKATIVYVQQTYKGVDVLNSIQTLAFKNGKLVTAAGGRLDVAAIANTKDGKAAILPADAVRAAAAHLKLAAAGAISQLKPINEKKEIEFGKLGISSVNVKSKLVWVPDDVVEANDAAKRHAYLCWQVVLQPEGLPDYWLVNIDAIKGIYLSKINLNVVCDFTTPKNDYKIRVPRPVYDIQAENNLAAALNSARYRVIPFPAQSPAHPGGAPAIVQNPWNMAGAGNNAVTLKWHDDGTTTFDSTRGNNVLAQEDRNGNNGLGKGVLSSTPQPDLRFLAVPDLSKQPTTGPNQRFAITNLFYWNNILHDVSHKYGFNEAAGNFQANNLGRGGDGNDYVLADAQDGSSSNNANFSTPPDGASPRMQMFLFDPVPGLIVNSPAGFAGKKDAVESAFSTNNKLINVGPVTGRVILYADNAANTTHLACGAAFNAAQLAGRIALIDRGNCDFAVKVKNAQNAGAIAAIVASNAPGEAPIIMGGADNTITIPAVMVSYETGDSMKNVIASNLNVTLSPGVKMDGDLDNGIIAHEYTHGISNRLTGGPEIVTCLQNKELMGEGWSDYMALMLTTNWSIATLSDGTIKRPIATYVVGHPNDGPGIRIYPYSTDFGVNPWTYDSMKLSSRFSNNILLYYPHIVGEVWCNMLWEMTWEIIQETGTIQPKIYNSAGLGGNVIALKLVMQGMKLQPCSPGFVSGRNAILDADTLLYGGAYSDAIWRAFARRGLGVNANQGNTNNIKDGVADYSVPSLAPVIKAATAKSLKDKGVTISPNPATDKISLTVNGNKETLKVYIMDAAGKQVRQTEMKGQYLQMNLSHLTPGMYYVKITGDTVNHTGKLVIQ